MSPALPSKLCSRAALSFKTKLGKGNGPCRDYRLTGQHRSSGSTARVREVLPYGKRRKERAADHRPNDHGAVTAERLGQWPAYRRHRREGPRGAWRVLSQRDCACAGPCVARRAGQNVRGRTPWFGQAASATNCEHTERRGITVEPSGQVLKEIWSKLALNVETLPTSASVRVTADHLLDTPEMQLLMKGLLQEVVAVANAQNIPLDFSERWDAITDC
jgi:hypothetical protein